MFETVPGKKYLGFIQHDNGLQLWGVARDFLLGFRPNVDFVTFVGKVALESNRTCVLLLLEGTGVLLAKVTNCMLCYFRWQLSLDK